jgi:hypothetical protein
MPRLPSLFSSSMAALAGHVAAPTATRIIQGYFDRIDPEHKPRPIAEGPAIKLRTTLPASAGAR